MDYQQWNDTLAEYFFNESHAYEEVLLYVNDELINRLGRESGSNLLDFIEAIKEGPAGAPGTQVCEKAYAIYDNWRKSGRKLPPYLAYLSFFVLVAATEDEEFVSYAYYPKFRKFLGEPDPSTTAGFQRMALLWEDLERWSREDKHEELGRFVSRIRGNWRHVGIPSFQTLSSIDEIRKLPRLFWEAGLDPVDPPAPEVMTELLYKFGSDVFRMRTLKMLYGDSEGATIFKVALTNLALEQLERWDGTYTQEERVLPGSPQRVQAGLRICLNVDFFSGIAQSFVRFKSRRAIPEEGLHLVQRSTGKRYFCMGATNGWSTYIGSEESRRSEKLNGSSLDWMEGEFFDDETGEWRVALKGASTRAFKAGLDNLKDWVEVQRLERAQEYLVASVGIELDEVKKWGSASCDYFKEVRCSGLPDGWKLFKCVNIRASCPSIGLLTISFQARLSLTGGIRSGRRNTYFDFARPKIAVENASGTEIVKVNGVTLQPQGRVGEWELPEALPAGVPIRIDAFSGEECFGSRIVQLEAFDLLPDFTRTPYLNSSGDIIQASDIGPKARGAVVFGLEPKVTERSSHDLPFYLSDRIVFIGKTPGQIFDWPSEEIPINWFPVWAVARLSRKKWQAHYCGMSVEGPNVNPTEIWSYGKRSVKRWKEAVFINRKITQEPGLRIVKELWRSYKECAARV